MYLCNQKRNQKKLEMPIVQGIISSTEVTRFLNECQSHYLGADAVSGRAFSLHNLAYAIKNWDPLEYWGDKTNQKAFPTIYEANLRTLSLFSTSVFQESIFSSCGATLGDRRRRLVESPSLMESLALMRVQLSLTSKNTQKEHEVS
jgi:hypothetical protein